MIISPNFIKILKKFSNQLDLLSSFFSPSTDIWSPFNNSNQNTIENSFLYVGDEFRLIVRKHGHTSLIYVIILKTPYATRKTDSTA